MGTETRTFGSGGRESHDSSRFYARELTVVDEDLSSKPNPPSPQSLDALFCKSSEKMEEVADDSVGLMVTSPPYHVGKEYDTDDSFDEYLDLLSRVFEETYRVLEPGARAAINVAGLGRRPYLPLSTFVDAIMLGIGFFPRGEIIWVKGEGANGSCAWGSWMSPNNPSLRDVHEKILVYSKGRFSRAKKGTPTITRDEFMENTLSVWKMQPEKATRVGHPAPFPVELPRRLIELYTYKEDLVLDPFIGVGTTAVAAVLTGRRYVGYDNYQPYIDLANQRLEKTKIDKSFKDQ